MEFQQNYIKSKNMMLLKYCTQYASKFGKLSSGHRTGKGHFSFQSQRKSMPKNVQTSAQLHSSHTLAKQCAKFYKRGFNSTWIVNFQIFKGSWYRKGRGTRDQLSTFIGSSKKRETPKTHLLLLYWLRQSLRLCGSQLTVGNSSRDGNTRPSDQPPEKSVCRSGSNS